MTPPIETPATKAAISELRAAGLWSDIIIKRAEAQWPTIYGSFRQHFGTRFAIEDQRMALYNLSLAAMALDLQAVKNLFSAEQAKRIEAWVANLADTKDWGEYALRELRDYSNDFQKEVSRIEKGGNPLSAIPTRLLRRWLGDDIINFDFIANGEKTGLMDPTLIDLAIQTLMPFAGIWKSIKAGYEIVEEDLPINLKWESYGLYDQGQHPDDKAAAAATRSSGARSAIGGWLRPMRLIRLLSGRSRIGTDAMPRVLVKGPWNGIKETRVRLSAEAAKEFVGENGCAYAFCVFDKGVPAYTLTKKENWENWTL